MAEPSLDGIYCFPWPDTGAIEHYRWFDCAASDHQSIAMSLERFEEFRAAVASGEGSPPAPTSGPDPEVIAAISIVFGVTLAALSVIWGLKQIHKLLTTNSGSGE